MRRVGLLLCAYLLTAIPSSLKSTRDVRFAAAYGGLKKLTALQEANDSPTAWIDHQDLAYSPHEELLSIRDRSYTWDRDLDQLIDRHEAVIEHVEGGPLSSSAPLQRQPLNRASSAPVVNLRLPENPHLTQPQRQKGKQKAVDSPSQKTIKASAFPKHGQLHRSLGASSQPKEVRGFLHGTLHGLAEASGVTLTPSSAAKAKSNVPEVPPRRAPHQKHARQRKNSVHLPTDAVPHAVERTAPLAIPGKSTARREEEEGVSFEDEEDDEEETSRIYLQASDHVSFDDLFAELSSDSSRSSTPVSSRPFTDASFDSSSSSSASSLFDSPPPTPFATSFSEKLSLMDDSPIAAALQDEVKRQQRQDVIKQRQAVSETERLAQLEDLVMTSPRDTPIKPYKTFPALLEEGPSERAEYVVQQLNRQGWDVVPMAITHHADSIDLLASASAVLMGLEEHDGEAVIKDVVKQELPEITTRLIQKFGRSYLREDWMSERNAFVYMYKDSLDAPTFLSQLDRFCPDFPEVRGVLIPHNNDTTVERIPLAPMSILLYVLFFIEETGEVLLATNVGFKALTDASELRKRIHFSHDLI